MCANVTTRQLGPGPGRSLCWDAAVVRPGAVLHHNFIVRQSYPREYPGIFELVTVELLGVRVMALTLVACILGLLTAKTYLLTHSAEWRPVLASGMPVQGFAIARIGTPLVGSPLMRLNQYARSSPRRLRGRSSRWRSDGSAVCSVGAASAARQASGGGPGPQSRAIGTRGSWPA